MVEGLPSSKHLHGAHQILSICKGIKITQFKKELLSHIHAVTPPSAVKTQELASWACGMVG